MRRVVLSGPHARLRARRWDLVILGSALPGLVAAVRMAMARLRVLLVTGRDAGGSGCAREPFFLAGACSGGILDACLRELALPLIDRRRLLPEPVAYQVVLPEARVSIGSPALTAEELVTWGLAKPEHARALVHDLVEAGAAELAALLETPVVRGGGLRGLMRGRVHGRAPRYARGLPGEIAEPPSELAPVFEAQVRALVNVATPTCPPEARARLLGAALEGGCGFATEEASLHGLLEKRLTVLHGEVRAVRGKFELVQADNCPGLALAGSGEVWLGRALLVNAPLAPLRAWMEKTDVGLPRFLSGGGGFRRRRTVLMRAERHVIPAGMARRVICVTNPVEPLDGTNVVSLAMAPSRDGQECRIVASAVLPEDQDRVEAVEPRLEQTVRELMPFGEERLCRVAAEETPGWDDAEALEDPARGSGWPVPSELRVSSRPPVYRLAREELGVLGMEGDVLLGWHAGDAIRHELS